MAVSFIHPSDDTIVIHIAGEWKHEAAPPQLGDIEREFQPGLKLIGFEAQELKDWDSSLLSFLIKVRDICLKKGIQVVMDGLPHGEQRLLNLASPQYERKGVTRTVTHKTFFVLVADPTFDFVRSLTEILSFIGEAFLAFMKLLRGKANFRRSDLVTLFRIREPNPFRLFRSSAPHFHSIRG